MEFKTAKRIKLLDENGNAWYRDGIVNADDLTDGFTWGLIIGILGARFYYVIYEWSNYKNDIISAFYIWNGGMAIHGTIIGVAIFLFFYTKKRSLNTWIC